MAISKGVSSRAGSINWPFLVFWLTYLSIITGLVVLFV
jgi:hypothetical protein